ncbi:hypothetical protein C8R44DRAFT_883216 [Mycena epipterygia]|nr:hypothetical protein C8R44DRAFT_883216 [Mycena epipterygia]
MQIAGHSIFSNDPSQTILTIYTYLENSYLSCTPASISCPNPNRKGKAPRQFFFDYWRAFPWRLPLNEEPPENEELESYATAEDAFKALDIDISEEEKARKSKIQTDTKDKIKRWFNRQRPAQIGIQGNPFFDYLCDLRKRNDEPPPRHLPNWQYYMQHADFKGVLSEHWDAEKEDVPKKKRLVRRAEIAWEMLQEEPQKVREKLNREAEEAHKQALQEYEEADEGLLSVHPAEKQKNRACGQFLATVSPLLQGLQAYTRYTMNIVAAQVDGDGFNTAWSRPDTKWVMEGKKSLLVDMPSGGVWGALVGSWWGLEKAARFQTSRKTLQGSRRPDEISYWAKHRREWMPTIDQDFPKKFWEWWMSLNPTCVHGGTLVRAEADGCWSLLQCLGCNGLLNVLMCLKWWRGLLAMDSEEWLSAVADTTFVHTTSPPLEATANAPAAKNTPNASAIASAAPIVATADVAAIAAPSASRPKPRPIRASPPLAPGGVQSDSGVPALGGAQSNSGASTGTRGAEDAMDLDRPEVGTSDGS